MRRLLDRVSPVLVAALLLAGIGAVVHGSQARTTTDAASFRAAATVPAAATMTSVNYAGTSNTHQTLDAYYSAGSSSRPWVITIHGGSWAAGDKRGDTAMTDAVDTFTTAGYVVFNVDYDLVSDYVNYTGVPWSAQRADIMTALRYVRAHADAYGIDPDRGALYGFSAGGHDAASVGLYSGTALGIHAVVSSSGVLEPQSVTNPTLAGWAAVAMRCPNVTWTDCGARWRDFEPATHVNSGDPALLMFTGGADPIVPPSGAENLKAKCDYYGVPAQAVVVDGIGHSDTTWYGNKTNTALLLNFLAANTK